MGRGGRPAGSRVARGLSPQPSLHWMERGREKRDCAAAGGTDKMHPSLGLASALGRRPPTTGAPIMSRLFRRKSLDHLVGETVEPQHQLKRALGPVQLTLLGVGAIVGAGIFSTIGTAAAGGSEHTGAGPALVLSFVLVAIACGFAALCYSEFAAMVPVSGSAYTYAYATLGE